ncbi:MAG: hypothetical protein HC840_27050 [Leptolyngbyaceae cyanobacterium RM2_2_4]|nr:hypothetical protein [Leptolyngbyaceae cyanobacterium RM2_2_4]
MTQEDLESAKQVKALVEQARKKAIDRRYQEASADLDQAIQLNPADETAHLMQANVRVMLGDLHGAVKSYEKAQEIYLNKGERQKAEILEQPKQQLQQEYSEKLGAVDAIDRSATLADIPDLSTGRGMRQITAKRAKRILASLPYQQDPDFAQQTRSGNAFVLKNGVTLTSSHSSKYWTYYSQAGRKAHLEFLANFDKEESSMNFLRPWSTRRGIETTDYNNFVILVRAGLSSLADFLSARAVETVPDPIGQTVTVGNENAFAFQLQEHPWSIVIGTSALEQLPVPLSQTLGVDVIAYTCSDTAGCIGYELYRQGTVVEEYAAGSDEPLHFHSDIRQVDDMLLEDCYAFIEEFFLDHDAYEPGISYQQFFDIAYPQFRLQPNSTVTIRSPEFRLVLPGGSDAVSVPEFERVYFVDWLNRLRKR